MGRFSKFSKGWELAKQSLAVVRSDKSLFALLIVALVTTAFVGLAFVVPMIVLLDADHSTGAVIVAVIGGYALSFLSVFFGVALASMAATVMDGGDATLREGINKALHRLPQIAAWAVVLVLINVLISLLRSRAGLAGAVVGAFAGAAWGLVTFLVVPIIAFEGLGPRSALKRSSSLFRQRWGEQVTGSFSIFLIFFLLALPAGLIVVLGVILVSSSFGLGVVIAGLGVIALVVVAILGTLASGVFRVALYRYANGAEAAGPFTKYELQSAVTHTTRR